MMPEKRIAERREFRGEFIDHDGETISIVFHCGIVMDVDAEEDEGR